jgi:hypothetical protein
VAYTPPTTRSTARLESPRWVGILILVLLLLGLAWIVTFYIVNANGSTGPLITALANWNILIGFGFIIAGFVALSRWR